MSSDRTPYLGLEFPSPRKPAEPDVWERQDEPEPEPEPAPRRVRTNVLLFVATVASVFWAGAGWPILKTWLDLKQMLLDGWTFAIPLMAILLVHEFGHYIAARLHGVDASLPYFLPAPLLSPFGTMGAVIAMQGRIRSRNALLDIGASGPLAGLVIAIPVLVVGLTLSTVGPGSVAPGTMQEGQSLLYLLLKRAVLGPIPDGWDVQLHQTAFAGWAGLFVTMLNLLPWGQLDGGHVAYALLGNKHDAIARWFRVALLPLFLYNATCNVLPVLLGHAHVWLPRAISNSLFWLVWYAVLGAIARASGGSAHPRTEPGELSPVRRVVAIVTLVLFVLLFMPTPLITY